MRVTSVRVRRGAAFVDLLVVMGIIAVLAALVVPMMMTARDRSTRTRCMTNLREIGLAMQRYADENKGRLPRVRMGEGVDARPDVSNGGFDSPLPFSLAGPPENNVPAVLFLLIRTQGLDAETLLCPARSGEAALFDGTNVLSRSNFSDVGRDLMYGVQNPYANDEGAEAGFVWNLKTLGPEFVLAADRGPAANFCDPVVSADAAAEDLLLANSRNHGGKGQNALRAHGGVEYVGTPFAGIKGDHIYRTKRGGVMESPVEGGDTVLLPLEE